MVYRRVGKGVLVYSLGPDMKDSGGEFKHPPLPLTQTQPGMPTNPPDDLSVDDDVCEIYDDAYRTETARLATATPDNPSDIFPPASAGLGWGDFASCRDRRRERDRERQLANEAHQQ